MDKKQFHNADSIMVSACQQLWNRARCLRVIDKRHCTPTTPSGCGNRRNTWWYL